MCKKTSSSNIATTDNVRPNANDAESTMIATCSSSVTVILKQWHFIKNKVKNLLLQ